MHKKIQEVLENILQDKNETDKFLKMESADEVYDYFVEKISNLSEEEFENFMIDTLETYIHEQGKTQKLDPDALSNVSGGVSLPKRFAAGVISILTLMPSASGLETSKSIPDKAPSYFSIAKDNAKHVKFQVSNRFRGLGRLIKENPIISSIVTAAILAVIIITVVLVRKHKKSKIQSQVGTGSMFQTPIQGATENSGSATHTPTHGENLDGAQQTTTPPGQPNRSASQSAPGTPPRGSSARQQVHQSTSRPEDRNNRQRITVAPTTNGSSIVSFDPNPRPTSDGASVRVQPTTPPTHANIPTASQPTPPPLPDPLPGSSANPASKPKGDTGSSDTEKSPDKYQGVNAAKKRLLAAAEKQGLNILTGGIRKQPSAAAPRSPSPTASALGEKIPKVWTHTPSIIPITANTDARFYDQCIDTLEKLLYDPTLSERNPGWHPPSQDSSEYGQRQDICRRNPGVFSGKPGSVDVSKAMRDPTHVIALRKRVQNGEIPEFVRDRIINGKISKFMQTEYENGRLPHEVRQLIADRQRAGSASTSSASATREDT